MKNCIITVVAATAIGTSLCLRSEDLSACSNCCNRIYDVAATDVHAAQRMLSQSMSLKNLSTCSKFLRKDKYRYMLATNIDDRLSSRGLFFGNPLQATVPWYPFRRMALIALEQKGLVATYTNLFVLANKYDVPMIPSDITKRLLSTRVPSTEDCVLLLSDICSEQAILQYPGKQIGINEIFKALLKNGNRSVRSYLKSQGVSISFSSESNPMAPYMERLSNAINAPRFSGLNEWLASVGISVRLDVSKLPSEQYISELKEDIIAGSETLSDKNIKILRICLGVDGYNAFIREYNGAN